jgi:hypothetical protein
MTELEALKRNYRAAFLRYLPRREESALTVGYELGREAVASGTSLLELAQIHHEILLDVLAQTRGDEVLDVATGASEFLLEVLATFDMAQRSLRDGG